MSPTQNGEKVYQVLRRLIIIERDLWDYIKTPLLLILAPWVIPGDLYHACQGCDWECWWSTLPSAQHLGQVNLWPLCLYYAVQLCPYNNMRCVCIVFILSVCQVVFSQRFIEEGNFRNRKRGKTSNILDMHTIYNIRDINIAYRNEIRTLINLITVFSVCVFCFLRLPVRDSSWFTCSKWQKYFDFLLYIYWLSRLALPLVYNCINI